MKALSNLVLGAAVLLGVTAFSAVSEAASCKFTNTETKHEFECEGVNIDGLQAFDKKNGNHTLLLFRRNDLVDVATAAAQSGACKIQIPADFENVPGLEHGQVNGVYLSEPNDVNAADASLKIAHTAFLLGVPVKIKIVAPLANGSGWCKLGYVIIKRGQ